jgi:hypothetical protein
MTQASSLAFVNIMLIHLTFVLVLVIISELSRIMGQALKKKPLYKLMYAAISLIVAGLIFFLIEGLFIPIAYCADIAGLLLGCYVTYYYWKWLPSDLTKG